MTENNFNKEFKGKSFESLVSEDTEFFSQPQIIVPIYKEDCQITELEIFFSSISSCLIIMEKTLKNMQIELSKRPTRFESMGQMLARHLIGDESNRSKEERELKMLQSQTNENTQRKMIDNIRLNLVNNVDNKITDMNKSIINIGEVFKTLKNDVQSKCTNIEFKINKTEIECKEIVDIIKENLIRKHLAGKVKKIFNKWKIQYNKDKKIKDRFQTIFAEIQPKMLKKPYFKKWHFISKNIKNQEIEHQKQEQKNLIKDIEKNINFLSDNLTELNSKKLDKYDFDNARKFMDVEYIKNQCDEIRDVIDVQLNELKFKIESQGTEHNRHIQLLTKQINEKSDMRNIDQLQKELINISNKAEEMKMDQVTMVERFSAMQQESKQKISDKISQLNSKIDFFQKELAKVWKFEDNLNNELDEVKETEKSINDLERLNSGVNLIVSRNKLVESTTSIHDKIKSNNNMNPFINLDNETQTFFNDSLRNADKSYQNVENNNSNNYSNSKNNNKLRNSITIDLIDTNQNKNNILSSTGHATDVHASNPNIIPRIRSYKSQRNASTSIKNDPVRRINLSQEFDLDNHLGLGNPIVNQRIKSAHSASVKQKNIRDKLK